MGNYFNSLKDHHFSFCGSYYRIRRRSAEQIQKENSTGCSDLRATCIQQEDPRDLENRIDKKTDNLQKIITKQGETIDNVVLNLDEKKQQIQNIQKAINKEKLKNKKNNDKKAIDLAATYLKNFLGTEYTLHETDSKNVLIQLCFDIIRSNQKLYIDYQYKYHKSIHVSSEFGFLFSIMYFESFLKFHVYGVKYDQGKKPIADGRSYLDFDPEEDKKFKIKDLKKLLGVTKQRYCAEKDISEFIPEHFFLLGNKCDRTKCDQRPQCETYKKVIAEEKKLQR